MTILADTSVWIDHFRSPNPRLVQAVTDGRLCCHEFVIGELALGSVPHRDRLLASLGSLSAIETLSPQEFLAFVQDHDLAAQGIGFVDAHLLASVARIGAAQLWTHDKRLAAQADRLNIAYQP